MPQCYCLLQNRSPHAETCKTPALRGRRAVNATKIRCFSVKILKHFSPQKLQFLMSQICRRSCDLCVGKADFKAIKKEWRMNEGLDDYDYAYDQNQKSSG
jgi:hypothetical protein